MACVVSAAAIDTPVQADYSDGNGHGEFMSEASDWTMASLLPATACVKPVQVPAMKPSAPAQLNPEMQTVLPATSVVPPPLTTVPADNSLEAKCKEIMNNVYGHDEEDSDCVSEEEGEESSEDARCLAFQNHLETLMQQFWSRAEEQTQSAITDTDFTRHDLPIARIKRIMRQDACDNPRLMGRDGASATAFGCELFIRALTTRSWAFAELSNRHTLQRRDLLAAIERQHLRLPDRCDGRCHHRDEQEAERKGAGQKVRLVRAHCGVLRGRAARDQGEAEGGET